MSHRMLQYLCIALFCSEALIYAADLEVLPLVPEPKKMPHVQKFYVIKLKDNSEIKVTQNFISFFQFLSDMMEDREHGSEQIILLFNEQLDETIFRNVTGMIESLPTDIKTGKILEHLTPAMIEETVQSIIKELSPEEVVKTLIIINFLNPENKDFLPVCIEQCKKNLLVQFIKNPTYQKPADPFYFLLNNLTLSDDDAIRKCIRFILLSIKEDIKIPQLAVNEEARQKMYAYYKDNLFSEQAAPIITICMTPDGNHIACFPGDKIRIYSKEEVEKYKNTKEKLPTGQAATLKCPYQTCEIIDSFIYGYKDRGTFNNDASKIAIFVDNSIYLYDRELSRQNSSVPQESILVKPIIIKPHHNSIMTALTFDSNNNLASASLHEIKIMKPPYNQSFFSVPVVNEPYSSIVSTILLNDLDNVSSLIEKLVFTKDNSLLAAKYANNRVKIWNVSDSSAYITTTLENIEGARKFIINKVNKEMNLLQSLIVYKICAGYGSTASDENILNQVEQGMVHAIEQQLRQIIPGYTQSAWTIIRNKWSSLKNWLSSFNWRSNALPLACVGGVCAVGTYAAYKYLQFKK